MHLIALCNALWWGIIDFPFNTSLADLLDFTDSSSFLRSKSNTVLSSYVIHFNQKSLPQIMLLFDASLSRLVLFVQPYLKFTCTYTRASNICYERFVLFAAILHFPGNASHSSWWTCLDDHKELWVYWTHHLRYMTWSRRVEVVNCGNLWKNSGKLGWQYSRDKECSVYGEQFQFLDAEGVL